MTRARRLQLLPLVLLAFVLGLVRDLARHADEVQAHVVCPQHGELVHVVLEATPHAHAREIRALPADVHDAGCELAELAPMPLRAPPPPPAVADAPAVAAVEAPPAPAAAPSSRAPLERAPKTSPPA